MRHLLPDGIAEGLQTQGYLARRSLTGIQRKDGDYGYFLLMRLAMASSFSAMVHMSLLSRRDTTAERWTLRSIRILAASRISQASSLRRISCFTTLSPVHAAQPLRPGATYCIWYGFRGRAICCICRRSFVGRAAPWVHRVSELFGGGRSHCFLQEINDLLDPAGMI